MMTEETAALLKQMVGCDLPEKAEAIYDRWKGCYDRGTAGGELPFQLLVAVASEIRKVTERATTRRNGNDERGGSGDGVHG